MKVIILFSLSILGLRSAAQIHPGIEHPTMKAAPAFLPMAEKVKRLPASALTGNINPANTNAPVDMGVNKLTAGQSFLWFISPFQVSPDYVFFNENTGPMINGNSLNINFFSKSGGVCLFEINVGIFFKGIEEMSVYNIKDEAHMTDKPTIVPIDNSANKNFGFNPQKLIFALTLHAGENHIMIKSKHADWHFYNVEITNI
jgi:hypothetical protein